MTDLSAISAFLDPYLIWAFRAPVHPVAAFGLGLVVVALMATVLGELCMAAAYFGNKESFAKSNREMVRNNNMSLRMLVRKNKEGYKLLNKEANEYFGKNFFSRIALFASSLFPAFFVMGWIDLRYGDIEFMLPWLGKVGPGFFFVPTYIAVRIAFAKAQKYLPVFKTIRRKVRENETTDEELLSFDDLNKEVQQGQAALKNNDSRVPDAS
ncbi:hypothetical protein [Salidesulfovibrio onnuriiensis]|uniref:hypothetical protein n=1 Tax=Salidesulfovibrio onnuriiensis TaxID=2583823 RepID=UPI0011C8DBE1|nr:hypothetical protein [Salidesulfovibrio onnuriiensis]